MTKTNQLAHFSPASFISDYWQQKPLLIKNALPNWQNPIDRDELAGLALEPEIESRIIYHQALTETSSGQYGQWNLEHGPFEEPQLTQLADHDWTLLVQAVDHYIPEVAALKDYFNFIPSWQIDDIMVSFASQGGGVGPHFDRYDVFLVQGQGQREWKIGQQCNQHTPLQKDQSLSLLKNFEQSETYVLSAGDILYVPPYYAHWGTSLDNDCMTYSVGFRAPSIAELVDDYSGYLQSVLSEDDRFRETISKDAQTTGRISDSTLKQLASIMGSIVKDEKHLSQWFGRWASEKKYTLEELQAERLAIADQDKHQLISQLEQELSGDYSESLTMIREDSTRCYFIDKRIDKRIDKSTDKNKNQDCLFFINGREISLANTSNEIIETFKQLCQHRALPAVLFKHCLTNPYIADQLNTMLDRGEIYIEE